MSQGLHIGEVARETGIGIHAVRFYEREGLLKVPLRSEGGYRIFNQNTISDLKFIRKGQELGFSLQEIRELLVLRRSGSPGCSHTRELIRQKLALVEAKIQELAELENELKAALRKCNRDLKRSGDRVEKACPVLQELGRTNGDREA